MARSPAATLPSLDEAEQAVATAAATLDRWSSEVSDKARELAAVQESAGADLVDDPDLHDEITRKVVELSAAHDLASRAAAEAEHRVDGARRVLLRVQAARLRERAAVLDRIADERQKRTDALLAELAEFEGGCRWVLWRPQPGETGPWKVTLTEVVRREVKHLVQLAEEREYAAANGADSAIQALSDRPVPPPRPIEWEMTHPSIEPAGEVPAVDASTAEPDKQRPLELVAA